MRTEMELTLEQTQQGVSYEVLFDESDTYVLERFDTPARNNVKKILLKLNLSDHRSILTDSKEYLKMVMERQSVKVKKFKKDALLKIFKIIKSRKERTLGAAKALMNAKVDKPRISDIPVARDITDVFLKC
ncbi:hypothetical protein Tco_1048750 [Tanacetum coccineum]